MVRRASPSRALQAGFSLVEVVVALAVLSLVSMSLVGTVAASGKITAVARERGVALGACRSYIEEMRALTLEQVMTDTRTPADFLPATGFRLPGAVGEVWKVNHENGNGAAWLRGTPRRSRSRG
jgi:prepilin-type N-terminal cleavage/methylation domain-containing protein